MIEVIKGFYEIDRNTKINFSCSPCTKEKRTSMLVSLPLAIRYGPSLRSRPNLMVPVKGLPTYT